MVYGEERNKLPFLYCDKVIKVETLKICLSVLMHQEDNVGKRPSNLLTLVVNDKVVKGPT